MRARAGGQAGRQAGRSRRSYRTSYVDKGQAGAGANRRRGVPSKPRHHLLSVFLVLLSLGILSSGLWRQRQTTAAVVDSPNIIIQWQNGSLN